VCECVLDSSAITVSLFPCPCPWAKEVRICEFVTAEKDCNAETGFADIAGMKTKVGVNAVVDLHTAQAGSSVTATVH
jgi:hypothetical protein